MTGLRQGELLGLRWRDVDFEARRVRVVSPFVRGAFGDPKSEGSGRSVPLAERAAVRSANYACDRCTRATATWCSVTRTRATRLTARSSSVASSRPSCEPTCTTSPSTELRHTFGTRMAAAGTPLRTLQHWMGHADSKTTQVYAHYQPSEGEADAVDRAFA